MSLNDTGELGGRAHNMRRRPQPADVAARQAKELQVQENALWEARAHMENTAAELERKARHLREKAQELAVILDPPARP